MERGIEQRGKGDSVARCREVYKTQTLSADA